MAANFRTRTSRSAIELVGQDTRDAVETWVQTVPGNVTFPIRVAESQWSASQVNALAAQYSSAIEALLAEPNVQGIYYEQDVNAAGDTVDNLVFVVSDDSGEFTRELREPLIVLILGNIDPVLAPVIAELNAVAAL